MEIIGFLSSILIGVSLGLIGGGGSILTVPILVYLFKVNPEQATSYSLFIVGMPAFFGSVSHYKIGNLKFKTTLFFAVPSVISLLIVRKYILPKIPNLVFTIYHFEVSKSILLMVVFAILMIAASVSMIKKRKDVILNVKSNSSVLFTIGMCVGSISGFLGAGGGFLIIPTLIYFANLSMKQAVGTSLSIIFITSFIGFSGDLINGVAIDFKFLTIISLIAVAGLIIGVRLSKKIEGTALKPIFGWFILIMGIYIVVKELFLK